MITVASYSKVEDAYLAASLLESCEIPVIVKDAETVQMYWLYSNAIGGVKVQVPSEYLEEARKILELEEETNIPKAQRKSNSRKSVVLWPLGAFFLVFLVTCVRVNVSTMPYVPNHTSELTLIPAIRNKVPVEEVKFLIELDPNRLNERENGMGVLYAAGYYGSKDIFEYLIKNCFRGDRLSKHCMDDYSGRSILYSALSRNDSNSVRLILENLDVRKEDLTASQVDIHSALRKSKIDESLKKQITLILTGSQKQNFLKDEGSLKYI